MYKRGFYANGKQRWCCPDCGKVFSKKRRNFSLRKDILSFTDWILNKETAARSTDKSRTTFYRINKKFWEVEPKIPITGEIYKALIVDTKFLNKRLSVLVAITPSFAVAYRWSDHGETTNEYLRLLSGIPEPSYIVCDGNRALLGAVKRVWPQRCFFHLEHYVDFRVGKKSKTQAGVELKKLLCTFMAVRTKIGARRAELRFWRLFEEHKAFITERIYRKDVTSEKQRGKSWWYAHKKLLAAWNHIANVIRDNQLWWWLEDDIPRTTNDLEGGYNARVAELLRCHRGINRERQKRIVEWYLLNRSEFGIDGFLDNFLSKNCIFFET